MLDTYVMLFFSLKTATITDEYNDEGFQINSDQKSLL